jgi:hypothetical protein
VIAAGSTVTTEQDPRGLDPGLTPVSGDFDTMDSETAYRDLEQGYRCSEQYAAMRWRYPQLRFWIPRCHPSDLVGDAGTTEAQAEQSSALVWERSHGEG